MKIGILQTGQAPDVLRPMTGDYPAMFMHLLDRQGFSFATWLVEEMEFPAGIHEADGWLITGSRHGVYEDHPFIAPLEQFIRDALDAGVPVVGICFGHQIMAQALGGRVEKFAGGWAVGPQTYEFGTERLTLNAWHQDQVIVPPDGAVTLAQNDFCAHAALAYGPHGLSVQAHPEYDDGFIQGLIDTRGRGLVPDTLLRGAEARFGGPRASDRIAALISRHFRQHARADAQPGAI